VWVKAAFFGRGSLGAAAGRLITIKEAAQRQARKALALRGGHAT